jgi:hypothetical protein
MGPSPGPWWTGLDPQILLQIGRFQRSGVQQHVQQPARLRAVKTALLWLLSSANDHQRPPWLGLSFFSCVTSCVASSTGG